MVTPKPQPYQDPPFPFDDEQWAYTGAGLSVLNNVRRIAGPHLPWQTIAKLAAISNSEVIDRHWQQVVNQLRGMEREAKANGLI